MATKIQVLVYRPGQPGVVEEHGTDLAAAQALVEGYIESVPLGSGIYMTCNEEGKLKGLEPNFMLPGDVVVGTVFFHGVEDAEIVALGPRDVERVRKLVGR
jgi:hypothetical protein